MISYKEILDAQNRLKGHATQTPLLRSDLLDQMANRRIWVKAECLQRTGSFKFRGAWNAISSLSEHEKSKGVLAYSSGNHAQGVALAAKEHNVDATIIMPLDSPKIKIENTKNLGAKVEFFDRATEDRDDVAKRVDPEERLVLIKPFDNEKVIAGQGTVGLEIAEQTRHFDIQEASVLVCCGGGGLTSGIALALSEDVRNFITHPVEPVGFNDVQKSLENNKIECNEAATGSICDAILTTQPGFLTFPIMKRHCANGLVVSDEEALKAMAIAFQYLRIVTEPGGAVALAAALFRSEQLNSEDIIVVASGGNVDNTAFKNAISF